MKHYVIMAMRGPYVLSVVVDITIVQIAISVYSVMAQRYSNTFTILHSCTHHYILYVGAFNNYYSDPRCDLPRITSVIFLCLYEVFQTYQQ